eukprot:gene4535-6749_t
MEAAYIKSAVGPALADALCMLSQCRPEDPIEWLADYLRHDHRRQQLLVVKRKEREEREAILLKAQAEEEYLAELKHEEERLANLRKPNEHQLDCMAFLRKISELENTEKEQGRPQKDIGSALLLEARRSLSSMKITDEIKALESEPPRSIQHLIRAGMIVSGYAIDDQTSWEEIAKQILNEYALERFEAFDLMAVATKQRLRRALQMVAQVDFLARPVQKHPLGPIATRFHTLLKAAVASLNIDTSKFLVVTAVEEDRQTFQRTIWTLPEDINDALELSDADNGIKSEQDRYILSTLPGLDHLTLSKDVTMKPLQVEVWWRSQDGQDTDADASLIMFSNHGQPVDSLYHLVRLSQDGSIKHMGDTGEEVEAESFMFHFSEVSQDVHVIAVVLNVATDGESLEYTEQCGLRVFAPDEETQEQKTVASLTLDTSLINRHEILLALIHRDREDPMQWHVVGIGEQVKGQWREKEESQNFLNALPLSQRYIELLGIAVVNEDEKKVMHPFKMVPGDTLEVPALAVEHPVVIGMGWDVDPDVAMDLDCGLAAYSQGQRIDYCDFEKLVSNDQAIHHLGDNRDGEGEGDDESIVVEFNKLDPETDTLFLYAAVYEGGALRDVENVHIRMLSKRGGKQKEICRFSLDWLARVEDDTAVILAKITRTTTNTWMFNTIGTTAPGRTIEELESRLTELL